MKFGKKISVRPTPPAPVSSDLALNPILLLRLTDNPVQRMEAILP